MSPSRKHGESWAKPNLYGWMKFGPFQSPSELDQRSILFSLKKYDGWNELVNRMDCEEEEEEEEEGFTSIN